jgi:GT2 family glycosyltransferase
VFERVGLLAEEYFFGFEDLDFCLRAREAGFRTVCVGDAIVQHEGSVSIGRTSGRRAYFAVRNHLLLSRRVSSGAPALSRGVRAAAIVAFNFAHVLVAAEVSRMQGLPGFLRGVRDYFAGRFGPGPS